MIFAGLAAFLGFAAGYAQGGRVLRIRWAGLDHLAILLGALGLQIWAAVLTMTGVLPAAYAIGALVFAQGLVLVWLALHVDRPGVLLLVAGLSANTAVIAANGGMPVSPEAFAAIGATTEVTGVYYHTLTEASRLPFLADVIPVPPLRSVISPGDVLVALGLIPFLGHLTTSPAPGLHPLERRTLGPSVELRAVRRVSAEAGSRAA